ncbi:MBL fold metallo-hydrolase [Deinococcus cellulosilyticus]|uniref:MBL fold metallo-hydrolase n=1 Tax=Deinococcus cellulosilyticus (strain DSM 18568 / NBRC 106333 / KACC 11606 / 5516J-15) TaxID=1223518 RepID=A0A511MV97_DEIC1|nr:MBL fold metallo-hydrolase [Deinococcus cellulosilyticus]GEM44504.1 MBL fold metallo-hydrolase [Deinococcus cellulosilyticus NBRC 106333 = KACC 11606]
MTETFPLTERPNTGWDARIRVFDTAGEVDAYVITTERHLVLVDTTSTPEQALKIMLAVQEDLSGRSLLVINTHQHSDHTWGNAIFTSTGPYPAPIIAHEVSAQLLSGGEPETYLKSQQEKNPRFAQVKIIPPTVTFTGEMKIHGGDLTLHLIHTPGHLKDHLAVWIPEIQTLLTGDAAEHPIPYTADPAELPVLIDSLERMHSLNAQVVFACHGGTSSPDLLARNLKYYQLLKEKTAGLTEKEQVQWSFDQAMQDLGLAGEEFPKFYRHFHDLNIISMLQQK